MKMPPLPQITDVMDFKFSVGNLVSILTTVVAVTWLASATNAKLDTVATEVQDLKTIPPQIVSLETRVSARVTGVENRLGILENRADTGRGAREALEGRVVILQDNFNDLKVLLGRIEERIINLSKDKQP